MADQSQPQEQAQQALQAGQASRAPQSSYEADAPRVERAPKKDASRLLNDWASI